jgi:ABC-2 type transport system ATP-binding protein
LKGVPRHRQRAHVDQAIDRCGVAEVRRKLIGHISRGYRQRVGLADALVANPPCLILDEPTTGLDPNQRLKMKELIRELAADHTVLFSSHILSEVEAVSSRILIIDHGVIRADGTPTELVQAARRGRSVWLTVAADQATTLALFDGLIGVQPGEITVGQPSAGFTTASAGLATGADPRDELAQRVADRNLRLRELKLVEPTLEDLFHQLTTTLPGGGPQTVAVAS